MWFLGLCGLNGGPAAATERQDVQQEESQRPENLAEHLVDA